jgi:hypothetical protein
VPKPTRQQRKHSASNAAAELSSTAGSDSDAKQAITAGDLQGLKFFKRIGPMLKSLHRIGAQRDKAGNRELHMDEQGHACRWLSNAHTSNAKTMATDHPVRYIEIEAPAHVRTGRGGNHRLPFDSDLHRRSAYRVNA